ncbi:Protein kinase domain-containing protein [Mycena venus]|uniref:Protein kinase domain-containing protein n=1 Tax=Mycena venus TaxID=2733690 RepID=A0A8H6YXZ6_9AGAR|nr:Protein kinase domain-containing protein [Mycena venus]
MPPSIPSIQIGRLSRDDLIKIPDAYSRYANFKYRLWFTWYIWHNAMRGRRRPPWLSIVCGVNATRAGDLWLWQDTDEEWIREFTEELSLDSFRPVPEMPLDCWDDACRAIEARQFRNQLASPLSHLAPNTRFRLIAWLLVAGPLQKNKILQDNCFPSIDHQIYDWAEFISLDGDAETCDTCRVSHLLPVWMETMLPVYLLDDLRAIAWYPECNCFDKQLTTSACSEHCQVLEIPLGKDSSVLHALYELVVPAWLLLHWVAFRTVNHRTDLLPAFLDILHGPDRDLFTWDGVDDSELCFVLAENNRRLHLYPEDWSTYMVEIPLETWAQIRKMTWTEDRPRRGSDDMRIRLAAVFLRYSSTPMAFRQILAPLNISFDYFPFATMARVVDTNYRERPSLANFESEEFWVTQNLEDWLSARTEVLCHAVWHNSPSRSSVLERVDVMDLLLNTLPQSLTVYTYSLILQWPDRDRGLNELLEFGDNWVSGFLETLKHYSFNVEVLLGLVKQSVKNSPINHTISTDVYEHMKRDISAVVAKLVLLLRNPQSYKKFLACRVTDAQRLLDLLQDLLDLDSFSVVKPLLLKALLRLSRVSGLHPRCFPLPELQKIGQQVAAGGFGDIWKGFIRGQSVSVKIMRIFEDSDVHTVLKEFGREAIIWRQLYHPNLLPFFGLYYLENRLCLVSPWMENGNVMEFLTNKNPSSKGRLSLILDVALGLKYLHENNIIHGDLKGPNILVTPSRRACIADFGVSSIANAITVRFTHSTITNARRGTTRYQAPELLCGESENHFGSDVYAFACVCYEIMAGNVPFHDLSNDATVMFKVLGGKRPPRPMACSGTTALDTLWSLMQRCWERKTRMRPSTSQIVDRLAGLSMRVKTTASNTDWDDKFTSKFRHSLQAEFLLPSVTQIERMIFGDEVVEDRVFSKGGRAQQPSKPSAETLSAKLMALTTPPRSVYSPKTTSIQAMEKWLADPAPVSPNFAASIENTYRVFEALVREPRNCAVFTKIPPIEFITIGILVHRHKARLSFEELARAVAAMRADVRRQHEDIRNNGTVYKTMNAFIDEYEGPSLGRREVCARDAVGSVARSGSISTSASTKTASSEGKAPRVSIGSGDDSDEWDFGDDEPAEEGNEAGAAGDAHSDGDAALAEFDAVLV